MALLIFAVLSLLVAGELRAGVVVGGTRFIFPADRESISILLANTSQESWLINSKINRPTRWAGGKASTVPAPLLAAPPLILLKPGTTGTLRLLRTESDILPVDRETLFELSIASVPSGKVENQSVKVAMRSVFKLFWRPEGLPGDAACVWLSDTHEQVNLLVVESGENAALCLLAQPCVVIAGRAMQLGDAIKIMNDRLKPQVNVDSFSLEQAV